MPRWLLYSLLTAVCFGVWGVLGKALGNLSAFQSQALSTVGVLPVMLLVAAAPGWRGGERRPRGSALAFGAGVLVGLGNTAYYHALALGGKASTAASLTALYPLASVALGVLLLGETLRRAQLAGVVASLGALYLLGGVEPGAAGPAWVAYALVPVASWGGASLVMKLSTRDVSAERATFWFLAAFVPLAAALLAAGEAVPSELSARDGALVALLGASYGLGNLALLAAYRHEGKVSVVTPLTGLYPVVTIPLAILLFGESVGPREWAGIALALAAGAALSYEPKPPAAATR